jgi:microcystin-dependent protein
MSVSVKISQLAEGGNIQSQDQIPISRGGETFKIPANQFVINGQNVGVGPGQLFFTKSTGAGSSLQFRTLSGSDGISVSTQNQTLVITASGQSPIKTKFFGDGSTTIFPIAAANSTNVNNYRIDIDGVLQEPGEDYTLNGTDIEFTTAPPLSSKVVVVTNNLVRTFDTVPQNDSVTTDKIVDGSVTTDKIVNGAITAPKLAANASIPAGAVMPFAMNTAPAGWLIANGDPVSRNEYAALFDAIGTTHGAGDGSTTFNLPDLRGIFVRGSGGPQTIGTRSYSATFAQKQVDEFKSHDHPYIDYFNTNANVFTVGGPSTIWFTQTYANRTTSPAGGDETRPANIALLYCIKY